MIKQGKPEHTWEPLVSIFANNIIVKNWDYKCEIFINIPIEWKLDFSFLTVDSKRYLES